MKKSIRMIFWFYFWPLTTNSQFETINKRIACTLPRVLNKKKTTTTDRHHILKQQQSNCISDNVIAEQYFLMIQKWLWIFWRVSIYSIILTPLMYWSSIRNLFCANQIHADFSMFLCVNLFSSLRMCWWLRFNIPKQKRNPNDNAKVV